MISKESGKVRYAYGVAMALLLGGTTFSLATGQAGAQVPQNAPGTSALAPRPGAPLSFADLVAKLQPAVVNISTKQRIPIKSQTTDPFEEFFKQFGQNPPQGNSQGGQGGQGGQSRTREAGSLGSGFIISPDGYIVTNNHLIQGLTGTGTVDTVTVTLADSKEYPARIIGRDDTSDLALLKIEGRNFPYVRWGDSTVARVGDWVIAIGDPYGVGSTVTAGIISALHRGITGVGAYDRYIQTDAAINMIIWSSVAAAAYSLFAAMGIVASSASKSLRVGSGASATQVSTSFSLALIGVGHLVGLAVGAAMVRVLAEDHDTYFLERRELERAKPVRLLREDPLPTVAFAKQELLKIGHVRLFQFVSQRLAPARRQPETFVHAQHPSGANAALLCLAPWTRSSRQNGLPSTLANLG